MSVTKIYVSVKNKYFQKIATLLVYSVKQNKKIK